MARRKYTICFLILLASLAALADVGKAPDGTTVTVPDSFPRSAEGTRDQDWYLGWWDRKADVHIDFTAMEPRRPKIEADIALCKEDKKGLKPLKIAGAVDAFMWTDEAENVIRVYAWSPQKRYVLMFREKGKPSAQLFQLAYKVAATLKIKA